MSAFPQASVTAPPRSSPGLLAAGRAQLQRDLRLVWRRRGDAMQPLLFALMVIALFPLSLGPESPMLARIAPGVLWVAVLLAGLLTLDSLFRSDLDDGKSAAVPAVLRRKSWVCLDTAVPACR